MNYDPLFSPKSLQLFLRNIIYDFNKTTENLKSSLNDCSQLANACTDVPTDGKQMCKYGSTTDGSAQGQVLDQTNKLLIESYDRWRVCGVGGLNG